MYSILQHRAVTSYSRGINTTHSICCKTVNQVWLYRLWKKHQL